MTKLRLITLLLSAGVLAGCTAGPAVDGTDDEEPAADMTKAEAAEAGGKSDRGHIDFCAWFGWYDDNECDTFCPHPDPDCDEGCREDADCPAIFCVRAPCPTMACVDNSCEIQEACEPVLCELYCENGFKTNEEGCEVCECEPPVCEPLACRLDCPFGLLRGDDGCDQCACAEPPPPADGCAVGGCSGQLCFDPATGSGISTCEWREEYACYGRVGECKRQDDGECGWTDTRHLSECIEEAQPEPECGPQRDGSVAECPVINCVRAPCPTNECVGGECVLVPAEAECIVDRDCPNPRCAPGYHCPHFDCIDFECVDVNLPTSCEVNSDCADGEYCQRELGCGAPGVCEELPTGPVVCTAVAFEYCTCEGETKFATSGCVYEPIRAREACEPTVAPGCEAQDVRNGRTRPPVRWGWNGSECFPLTSGCVGRDCGDTFRTEADCQREYDRCIEPEGVICGTRGAARCGRGEFCKREMSANCGRADAPGVCEELPLGCPRNYAPVCGCDGNTYSNECNAHAAGVSADYSGECAAPVDCRTTGCDRGTYCGNCWGTFQCIPDGAVC